MYIFDCVPCAYASEHHLPQCIKCTQKTSQVLIFLSQLIRPFATPFDYKSFWLFRCLVLFGFSFSIFLCFNENWFPRRSKQLHCYFMPEIKRKTKTQKVVSELAAFSLFVCAWVCVFTCFVGIQFFVVFANFSLSLTLLFITFNCELWSKPFETIAHCDVVEAIVICERNETSQQVINSVTSYIRFYDKRKILFYVPCALRSLGRVVCAVCAWRKIIYAMLVASMTIFTIWNFSFVVFLVVESYWKFLCKSEMHSKS